MEFDPEFIEALAKFMSAGGGPGGEGKTPRHNNPEKYARSTKITADEALLKLTELNHIWKELDKLSRQGRILMAKGQAAKEELFDLLDTAYPTIRHPYGEGGTGFRNWKGTWYYVGWDDSARGESDDGGELGGPGQYL